MTSPGLGKTEPSASRASEAAGPGAKVNHAPRAPPGQPGGGNGTISIPRPGDTPPGTEGSGREKRNGDRRSLGEGAGGEASPSPARRFPSFPPPEMDAAGPVPSGPAAATLLGSGTKRPLSLSGRAQRRPSLTAHDGSARSLPLPANAADAGLAPPPAALIAPVIGPGRACLPPPPARGPAGQSQDGAEPGCGQSLRG